MFNYKKIDKSEYLNNKPFPHIVLNDCWNDSLLKQCNKDLYKFEDWDGEKNFFGAQARKYSGNYKKFPESIQKIVNELYSLKFITWLKTLTNEEELIGDFDLSVGGIASVGKGGFLKVHADTNWNPKLKLYRRLTLLVFLNEAWKEEYGGDLELWTKDMKKCESKIMPLFNKMAIFTHGDFNYHGHPDPLKCPDEVRRNTIVLYYYSSIKPLEGFISERSDTGISKYKRRSLMDFYNGGIFKKIFKKIQKSLNF